MKNQMLLIALLSGLAMSANAQTLNVAETSGKGKWGAFVGSNALLIKDFTTAAYSWGCGVYGLNNRTDVYAGVASTTLLGQTQNAAMVGWNVNLLKSKVVSVSNFTLVTTPVHKRSEASEAVVFTSVVVSKNLGKVTPYSGYSVTLPIGDKADKLFTPPSPVHNIPVGVMIPKGKLAFFTEYNYGRTTKTLGVGLGYAF